MTTSGRKAGRPRGPSAGGKKTARTAALKMAPPAPTASTPKQPELLAVAFLTDADGYRAAAAALDESGKALHFSPRYFLLSHSIELALKAYILSSGGRGTEPKKLGHDLERALTRAKELGLSLTDRRIEQAIEWLAPSHKDMSFRYRQTGFKTLPELNELTELVSSLIDHVRPIVRRNFIANRKSGK